MTFLGHLGPKVSDLLDEQLDADESAAAWLHVDGCPACRSQVESEAWLKRSLSALGSCEGDRAPDDLRGWLSDDVLVASYADAPDWVTEAPDPAEQRRHRWAVGMIGGGAIGAAMLGVVALGAAPTQAPAPRVPVTNIRTDVDPQGPTGPESEPARSVGSGLPVDAGTATPGVGEDESQR
ncbi:hypothetical protein RDV89_13215 [Nocardioides zeae]|uniref:Zinc-finger domain-containing protein n=1 Tax=Nocardioides imazamoxiresistens TaxID=3231893 RepID=A0ABU3PYT6_9ACTN|nr:hypothetical protein [Nocardioides zeae]MDT9594036.1 hypothetical protein [Nocardioides zeae]